jgi:hypothetical protein
MDTRPMLRFFSALILGVTLGLGLLGSGFLIGKALYHVKAADRFVTVKGLVETPVKANWGVWAIDFREAGDNLTEISAKLEQDRQQIIQFLGKQGFSSVEITSSSTKVNDQMANAYGSSNAPPKFRYILTGGVRVQSSQVDLIQKANQMTGTLVQQGIALSFDSSDVAPNPSYFYTQLDSIRPNLLAGAIKSARLVAEQFAKNSGSVLGGIRRANQGVFQIYARDAADSGDNSWQATQNQLSAINKKVRLVATIDYFLKK